MVLTSVDRDDLEDGGSNHFATTVELIKAAKPGMLVECLVSDFRGSFAAVDVRDEPFVIFCCDAMCSSRKKQRSFRQASGGWTATAVALSLFQHMIATFEVCFRVLVV